MHIRGTVIRIGTDAFVCITAAPAGCDCRVGSLVPLSVALPTSKDEQTFQYSDGKARPIREANAAPVAISSDPWVMRRGDGNKQPVVITLYCNNTTDEFVVAEDRTLFGSQTNIQSLTPKSAVDWLKNRFAP